MCSTVHDEICETEYSEQCGTEEAEDCEESEKVCRTAYDIVSNIQCSQIDEEQCRTFYVPECETITGLSLPPVQLSLQLPLQTRFARRSQRLRSQLLGTTPWWR